MWSIAQLLCCCTTPPVMCPQRWSIIYLTNTTNLRKKEQIFHIKSSLFLNFSASGGGINELVDYMSNKQIKVCFICACFAAWNKPREAFSAWRLETLRFPSGYLLLQEESSQMIFAATLSLNLWISCPSSNSMCLCQSNRDTRAAPLTVRSADIQIQKDADVL